jgi:Collagen triple helix repeat (20 copies)
MGLVRRIFLFGAAMVALWAATLPAFAVEATLVADAHVNSALPGVNSGAISNLNVGAGYTAVLQFDLSTLPAGTTAVQVSRAMLRLYCNRVDTAGLVSVQAVGGAWGEYSVTYATLPSLGSAVQVAQVSQAGTYVTLDVTALVQGWIGAPATNNGLALTAGTAAVQFDSKENDLTGHAAMLDVSLATSGPAGPIGLTGAAGAQGVAGPAGPQGATGPVGPPGPAGGSGGGGATTIVSLNYQGGYAATTNYALNDVVAYQGSSYVSLIAGNHGNTPGLSLSQWGLLAAAGVGTTGASGATGATGPMGLTGPQGAAGPIGPTGIAGATGATGSPGLVYQGAYSAVTNYALGDVALWQGASYASLMASNRGNTPSLSPAQWGVLTAQGPTGATGAQGPQGIAGAQGLPGSVGPNGPPGPQGAQGIAGQSGAQGVTGPAGAQGATGPMGPQGVAGPVGMTFRGAYSATLNYALADGVLFGGAGYVSLVASNIGNVPNLSPSQWAMFATGTAGAAGAAGAAGPQGSTGAQGAQGIAGPQGIQGATGPQGPSVANYTGNYVATTNYGLHDAVSFEGSTYISLVAGNVGNTPSLSPTQWAVLAAQGTAGPAGVTGPVGPAGAIGATGAVGAIGPQGPPVSFLGGWLVGSIYAVGSAVSYGGTSYIALVANVGREPDLSPTYWGVLAQGGAAGAPGAVGAAGPQGLAGAVGINYRGAWASSVAYQANDAASFGGTTYLAKAGSSALEPDLFPAVWAVLAQAGSAGPTGPTGSAASVSVGTVTTGSAGSQATVTNSGTVEAAVLNFTIPQGAPGTGGGGGGAGTSGIPFASMFHSVSFSNIYYSVNNGNGSITEAASVLTWVPAGCTATNLSVFSQQSGTISVTLRQGTPTTMTDTTMACTVTSGAACTVAGNVAVGAGAFVDLMISGASGTAAGVWTALACN